MISLHPSAASKTLLIVGCGDVGMRVVKLLNKEVRVLALTSSPQRHALLRAAGVVPLPGDLDDAATLSRLAGLADVVLHLAPPPNTGDRDTRTANLLAALARRPSRLTHLVYGSTTGVYGHCHGERFDEARTVNPQTPRAQRRVNAEQQIRWFGRKHGVATTVLRIPGIYATDREGGHPRERLARGTPVLQAEDDVYTNHIHADDLARACIAALFRGRAQRVVHVCDDTELTMGDYFDLAADMVGLPRPERISREQAQAQLSPMLLSFMSESRRLRNDRLKNELRLRLRYPTVCDGLVV
ncbi:MAG: SDR family oxidoreductase [Burkholderiales bacterium]